MDPSVFRAALRASARVAFGIAAAGCGGVVGSGGEPAQSVLDEGGPPGDPPHDAGACATFDCCVAQLEAIAPGEGGAAFGDAATADPGVVACCAVVIARLDHDYGQGSGDPDASQATLQQDLASSASVRWACCDLTPSTGPTCTPWGPTMPPAMPPSTAEVA